MPLKVLFLLDFYPFPEDFDGKNKVIGNYIKLLSKEAKVDVICVLSNEEFVEDKFQNVKIIIENKPKFSERLINRLSFLPASSISKNKLLRLISTEELAQYDVVHTALDSFIQLTGTHPKIIVGLNDSYSGYYSRKDIGSILKKYYYRLVELNIGKKNLYFTFVAEEDSKRFPSNKSVVIPNGIDSSKFIPNLVTTQTEHSFVFHGVLDYQSNIDAVFNMSQFLHENYPNGKLYIVGRCNRNNPEVMSQIYSKLTNVVFIGQVDNVSTELVKYKYYLALMVDGAGLKNKILEAMSCGCIILTNKKGVSGFLEKDKLNEFLYIIENKVDFHNFWQDKDHWFEKAKKARQFIIENYTWERAMEKLNAFYTKILTS